MADDLRRSRVDRILIDAGNLQRGGAVQVAVSFIEDLAGISPDILGPLDVEVSPMVRKQLSNTALGALRIRVVQPGLVRRWFRRGGYDVRFLIFGHDYGPARASRVVAGFADVTSLYGSTDTSLKQRLRARVARFAFQRADALIVESRSVGKDLATKWRIGAAIHTVPNSLNHAFPKVIQPLRRPDLSKHDASRPLLFGYVTRGYPHKNLDFVGEVLEVLEESFGIRAVLLCTLTDEEFQQRSDRFREYARNVGPVSVMALPEFYAEVDAVVFPSLLESFSATPLEALQCGLPLFASDREFVREFAGGAAGYFDPLDPDSAAACIYGGLSDVSLLEQRWSRARALPALKWTSQDRTFAYLTILRSAGSNWSRYSG